MKSGKIKSQFIHNDIRLNAGYFLNSDAVNSRVIEINKDNSFILEKVSKVWNPPIFKRQFCSPSERAVKYCQSSDVTNALEGSEVYINKLQAIKVGCIVKEKQILVTGFGTIGNTRLVNELSSGISYANNVCRITVNDDVPYGFIYAFLTSKYGKSQLNKNASGSVVRYIEAPGIRKTLIPNLPHEIQNKIHDLIIMASKLRVEANKLLIEAMNLFENECDHPEAENIYNIKINNLLNHSQRLDANYNSGWFNSFYENLSRKRIKLVTISEVSEKVFTPGIFKRVRTQIPELGIPFLSGSNLLNAVPQFDSFLSKKMKNVDDYILKNGWLAIQDAGTIGYVSYINKYLDGVTATNNLIRIIPSTTENFNPYLFVFFKSKVGQKILKNFEFGSVQKHIDNYQINSLKIPVFENIFSEITDKVNSAMLKFGDACFKEKDAITLIEKEIDQWQQ